MSRDEFLKQLAVIIDQYEKQHPSNNEICCTVSFMDNDDCGAWNGEKFIVSWELPCQR